MQKDAQGIEENIRRKEVGKNRTREAGTRVASYFLMKRRERTEQRSWNEECRILKEIPRPMKIIAAPHRSGRHAQIFRENRLTRRPWKFSFGLLEFYNRPFLLQRVFELCSYQAFIISCSSRRSRIEYLR